MSTQQQHPVPALPTHDATRVVLRPAETPPVRPTLDRALLVLIHLHHGKPSDLVGLSRALGSRDVWIKTRHLLAAGPLPGDVPTTARQAVRAGQAMAARLARVHPSQAAPTHGEPETGEPSWSEWTDTGAAG